MNEYVCVTRLANPVIIKADGYTYKRHFIEFWKLDSDEDAVMVCIVSAHNLIYIICNEGNGDNGRD